MYVRQRCDVIKGLPPYLLQQIGRRPNMNTSLIRSSGNNSHNSSLESNLATWQQHQQQQQQQQQQQLRTKTAEELMSQHHQQQQQQRAMPLSPPLTPLPPRFAAPVQPQHLLHHSPPFAAAANLLFAAQQYNPFLAARGVGNAAGMPHPLPPPAPMEVLENLQRLLQLRQAELNARPMPKPENDDMVII